MWVLVCRKAASASYLLECIYLMELNAFVVAYIPYVDHAVFLR